MPLTRQALSLKSDPRSVRDARNWVTGILREVGRDDLLDSARLGVTELATNALLHGDAPISVRVRGTVECPRVQVTDANTETPRLVIDRFGPDQLLATIGRGLRMVAMHAQAWGCQIDTTAKTLWFDPAPAPVEGPLPQLQLVDVRAEIAQTVAQQPAEPGADRVTVQLLDMPAQVWAAYRLYYLELQRELTLLSLRPDGSMSFVQELGRQFRTVEAERQQVTGLIDLEEAIHARRERVDLVYRVPAAAPRTMSRMHELMLMADRHCRERQLLSLAASDQMLRLQAWYAAEFVRQARGLEPIPWPGGFTVEPRPTAD